MYPFYNELGPEKCVNIRLVVMDMWKAFEKSAMKNVPQAAILYDKFHILKHLGNALDTVRKKEYYRLVGDERKYIKVTKMVFFVKQGEPIARRENIA
jgi:transposase